jgi:KUP system potassium uptake protein
MSKSENSNSEKPASYKYLLALGALGVVYGDIGTSPLYALKEAFHPGHHMVAMPENILGLLSLIFWSLTIVISVKYLIFILRADNKGEGGILALTSLIVPHSERRNKKITKTKKYLILLGLFGTALLYGDGMITPAISILSAVEGLSLITPIFNPYIIPITIGILIALFALQQKGTGTVGKIFGPVTLIWFFVIAIMGIASISQTPEVLKAINPYYIISFFRNNAWYGFTVLGSVFLVVTGGEALYSDLGHFGRAPIKQAWFCLVLPSLVLNYFGQGALLIRNP